MSTVCVGIDVGSSSCKLAVIDKETRRLLRRAEIATIEGQLVAQIKALAGHEIHVHLEASELAEWVRFVVRPLVKRVVVSHPKLNKYIAADPRKSDKVDALKLAELLALEKFCPVYYSDDANRAEFKRVVQLYEKVVKSLTQRKLAVKNALRRVGVIDKSTAMYSEEGRVSIRERLEMSPMATEVTRAAVEELYQLLDETAVRRKNLLRILKPLAAKFPEIKRLEGVPGVGFALASRFVAYIQDPARFSNKRKMWQYCGLGVSEPTSEGKPVGREALDPNSVRTLKGMSRSAVLAALRCHESNVIKRTYEGHFEKSKNSVHARLNAQRKLVAILRAIWIGGVAYDEKKTDKAKEKTTDRL